MSEPRCEIRLASGRVLEIIGYSRRELVGGLADALRSQVPWSLVWRDTTISINPFAVETIVDVL